MGNTRKIVYMDEKAEAMCVHTYIISDTHMTHTITVPSPSHTHPPPKQPQPFHSGAPHRLRAGVGASAAQAPVRRHTGPARRQARDGRHPEPGREGPGQGIIYLVAIVGGGRGEMGGGDEMGTDPSSSHTVHQLPRRLYGARPPFVFIQLSLSIHPSIHSPDDPPTLGGARRSGARDGRNAGPARANAGGRPGGAVRMDAYACIVNWIW